MGQRSLASRPASSPRAPKCARNGFPRRPAGGEASASTAGEHEQRRAPLPAVEAALVRGVVGCALARLQVALEGD